MISGWVVMLEQAQISDPEHRTASRWTVPLLTMFVAGTVCLCFGGWSFLRFGHPLDGLAYLNGVVLKADQPDLGTVAPGSEVEAVFVVKNLTTNPVSIVGAKPDCACVVGSDLPLTIDALSSARLPVRFTVERGELHKELIRHVLLHLNVDAPPVVLTLTARLGEGG